jgi:hypothetical protein
MDISVRAQSNKYYWEVTAEELISTNNIATGMVRGLQVRFQSTQNTLSIHPPSRIPHPASRIPHITSETFSF